MLCAGPRLRLFEKGRLLDRALMDRRRWKPSGCLPATGNEIFTYITERSVGGATIIASD